MKETYRNCVWDADVANCWLRHDYWRIKPVFRVIWAWHSNAMCSLRNRTKSVAQQTFQRCLALGWRFLKLNGDQVRSWIDWVQHEADRWRKQFYLSIFYGCSWRVGIDYWTMLIGVWEFKECCLDALRGNAKDWKECGTIQNCSCQGTTTAQICKESLMNGGNVKKKRSLGLGPASWWTSSLRLWQFVIVALACSLASPENLQVSKSNCFGKNKFNKQFGYNSGIAS